MKEINFAIVIRFHIPMVVELRSLSGGGQLLQHVDTCTHIHYLSTVSTAILTVRIETLLLTTFSINEHFF